MSRRRVTAIPPIFGLNNLDDVPDVEACGFKAHNLIRMVSDGLPVPAGFVLGTAWCKAVTQGTKAGAYLPDALQNSIRALEHQTGLGFGSRRRPLLVSVRSGAAVSMPGMMDTVLNVGLNEESLAGLLRLTGDHRLAWDSYSRLISDFAEIVDGISSQPFERELDTVMQSLGSKTSRELDFRALRELAHRFLELYRHHTGHEFPQDPMEQLRAATVAVFESWLSDKAVAYRRINAIADEVGTAVTVQRMVFGNSGGNSGAGVGFTRDPSTGENRPYIDWLAQAQGEDIVSGRRRVGVENQIPVWLMQKLVKIGNVLENAFHDAQEYEFTVENGELFMLQTRAAKRTALATLRIAIDQVDGGLITREDGLQRIRDIDLDKLIIQRVQSGNPPLAKAIPAAPGVTSGPAAFSTETAQQFAKHGETPVLVINNITTEEIMGLTIASGILTATGGRTSHAAVVARQMGKVCLVGCNELAVDAVSRIARLGQAAISEGDQICLDGNTGSVYSGVPEIITERPQDLIDRVSSWDMIAENG